MLIDAKQHDSTCQKPALGFANGHAAMHPQSPQVPAETPELPKPQDALQDPHTCSQYDQT